MPNEKNNTGDRELKISRVLNAPVDLVWEVWTDREHIKNWWGATGFTTVIHKIDLKPDGEWLLTMYDPDGRHYPNKSVFREIIPRKKIEFRHSNPDFTATIEFENAGKQTHLHWHMLFDTKEEFETVVKTLRLTKA